MIILGIDPGTRCGWAVLEDGRLVASGVWDLSARRHEGGGMRFMRLGSYLREILSRHMISAVAYEEVRRHPGTDAAHVYGGIIAVVSAQCEQFALPYRGVPVGTIKKLATGKGNAGKPAMVAAFRERFDREPEDDNEADAAFVALTLAKELGQLENRGAR